MGVVAVILALSSAAFACTIWVGEMTVAAISTGPGNLSHGTVTGYAANMDYLPGAFPEGAGSSMQYCGGAQPSPEAFVDQDPATGLGTIDVTIATNSCSGITWNPGDTPGAWGVNWLPNDGYDCMNGIRIGGFDVTAGATSVTARITTVPNGGLTDLPGGYRMDAGKAAICADGPGIRGMQVKITVL